MERRNHWGRAVVRQVTGELVQGPRDSWRADDVLAWRDVNTTSLLGISEHCSSPALLYHRYKQFWKNSNH